MAYGQAKHNISRPAGEDLIGKEFHLVALDDGKLAGAGDVAFPLANDAAHPDGEPCALTVGGVSQVYYGDTVTAYAALAAGEGGLAVPATSGDQIIGYALEAGAKDTLGTMLVALNGLVPA